MQSSTFKALTYADRILQAQMEDPASSTEPTTVTPSTGIEAKEDVRIPGGIDHSSPTPPNFKSEKVGVTEQDGGTDLTGFEQVKGRTRREPRIDKGRNQPLAAVVQPGKVNGKKEESHVRVRNAARETLTEESGSNVPEWRKQKKTTWANLAEGVLPATQPAQSIPVFNPSSSSNEEAVTPLVKECTQAKTTNDNSQPETTTTSTNSKPKSTVNIWQVRKQNMAPARPNATASSSSTPQPSKTVFNALTSSPIPKATNKSTGKTKQSTSEDKASPKGSAKTSQKGSSGRKADNVPSLADPAAWPEVAKAAASAKAAAKKAELGVGEEVDTSAAGSLKKTKWKAIPASEMREALDQVQRQRKADQAAEKSKKGGSDEKAGIVAGPKRGNGGSTLGKNSKPAASNSGEGSKKSKGKSQEKLTVVAISDKATAADETTTSPVDPITAENAADQKPNLMAESGKGKKTINDGQKTEAGSAAKPIESDKGPAVNGAVSQPVSSSGPIASNAARGGRGGARGGRGSRGRGGSHAGYRPPSDMPPILSPGGSRSASLPHVNGVALGYSRRGDASVYGYAQPFYGGQYQYPMLNSGYPPAEGVFESYGQTFGHTPAPVPRPVTQVPGIDTLRSYILGQLEYYFSMQNLAMDFFLKQQMDTHGWVNIAMIASFNRVKSLTADVEVVKEVAELSSILDVKEQSIRLSQGHWRQWVLPNARVSQIPEDGAEPPFTGELPFGVGDFSNEARNKLVGDIHRDVMRSTAHHVTLAVPETSAMAAVNSDRTVAEAKEEDRNKEDTQRPTSVRSSSSSDDADALDKLEIII